jgi:hypothetical protein
MKDAYIGSIPICAAIVVNTSSLYMLNTKYIKLSSFTSNNINKAIVTNDK